MLAAIRTHEAGAFKRALKDFLATFNDPALLLFDDEEFHHDMTEAFERHHALIEPPLHSAIDLAIKLPGPTDSELLEIVRTLGHFAFYAVNDPGHFDVVVHSGHVDRALCFCGTKGWSPCLNNYITYFSTQGQVEALAGNSWTLDTVDTGLCVEDLLEDRSLHAALPELTRRYLASFPRHELERYEREDLLEELVLRGLTLATGCKPIDWKKRGTNTRVWLMLAAAKFKALAGRAVRRVEAEYAPDGPRHLPLKRAYAEAFDWCA